jgi:hypothetical protein
MASHLVGGEAHVARRVQVQVLLLPPRTGAPGDRSSSLGWRWRSALGKSIPFETGRAFGACAFDSRRYRQF